MIYCNRFIPKPLIVSAQGPSTQTAPQSAGNVDVVWEELEAWALTHSHTPIPATRPLFL